MATWPPYIDDDGTGTAGTPTDAALFNAIKAYIDGVPAVTGSKWQTITVTSSAQTGTFTFSGGTFTASIDAVQQRVFVDFLLSGGTTSASTAFLYLTLPASLPAFATAGTNHVMHYWGPGLNGIGAIQTLSGHTFQLSRDIGGTAWPATAGFYILGQISYLY